MIGIREDDARAEFLERFLSEGLDGCGSPHRHEYRRFNDAVRRRQTAAPRPAGIGLQNFKGEIHAPSVSAECLGSLYQVLAPPVDFVLRNKAFGG